MTNILPECSSGGRCLSVEYTDRVKELAKKHGLKLHINGARIFNALVIGTMFGCDKYSIKPDLVSLAKALSSAYLPIGAALVSLKIFPDTELFKHAIDTSY
ncbi:hypothetical protein JHK87_031570 [Glycine soja]|nr:hypothetical protein JHK87_031570 [Glycine soja]